MAKKAAPKPAKKTGKGPTAEEHRQAAATLRARADLHDAHARIQEARNPPKRPKGLLGY